jgi:hypothetical protein
MFPVTSLYKEEKPEAIWSSSFHGQDSTRASSNRDLRGGSAIGLERQERRGNFQSRGFHQSLPPTVALSFPIQAVAINGGHSPERSRVSDLSNWSDDKGRKRSMNAHYCNIVRLVPCSPRCVFQSQLRHSDQFPAVPDERTKVTAMSLLFSTEYHKMEMTYVIC